MRVTAEALEQDEAIAPTKFHFKPAKGDPTTRRSR